MIIDSQYRLILNTEGVVLHTETDGLIPDNSELMLLFMQLQQAIQDRNYPLYIIHIWSHTGLSGH